MGVQLEPDFNLEPTKIVTQDATSLTAQTDLVTYAADWPQPSPCGNNWTEDGVTGLFGLAWCESLNTANECEQYKIYVDSDYSNPRSGVDMRALACHEIGHTWGLNHSTDVTIAGCMVSPYRQDLYGLSQHNIDHINTANY